MTQQPESLISKICAPFWDMTTPKETPLRVSREAVERLRELADTNYQVAFKNKDRDQQMYFDGALRFIDYVLDMEDQ